MGSVALSGRGKAHVASMSLVLEDGKTTRKFMTGRQARDVKLVLIAGRQVKDSNRAPKYKKVFFSSLMQTVHLHESLQPPKRYSMSHNILREVTS